MNGEDPPALYICANRVAAGGKLADHPSHPACPASERQVKYGMVLSES